MYIEGRYGGSESDMLPPKGAQMCHSNMRGFGCTRESGHSGNHRAGTTPGNWVAEWDDDRSTDYLFSDEPDFFAEIGL